MACGVLVEARPDDHTCTALNQKATRRYRTLSTCIEREHRAHHHPRVSQPGVPRRSSPFPRTLSFSASLPTSSFLARRNGIPSSSCMQIGHITFHLSQWYGGISDDTSVWRVTVLLALTRLSHPYTDWALPWEPQRIISALGPRVLPYVPFARPVRFPLSIER